MIDEKSIKNVIQDYLLKYLDDFKDHLEMAIRKYNPDAIHDYRVSVKRIRAIVRALDRSGEMPVFPDGMIDPLRLMFKAGGTIRDDQVQIGLVEEIEKTFGKKFTLIKAYYQNRIDDQRKAFFVTSVDFEQSELENIRDQVRVALEQQDPAGLDASIYEWLHKSMAKLKRKRYDLDAPALLHRFRTRYKGIGYVVEMIYQSRYDRKVSKVSYNRMKDFGQELGNWHDHYQLWTKTSLIFQESRNFDLLEEAFELRKLIIPVHDRLFQEILHMIKRDDSLFFL